MELLPEDCVGMILRHCWGNKLAILAMVSKQWNRRALAEEARRFSPGIEPDEIDENDWAFIVSVGAYLSVVRGKFGPVYLRNACMSGCMDMIELALAKGACDYQDGFESAASQGHVGAALRMWGLLAAPDLEGCVFAVYAGGNADLMKLVKPDTQCLWNEAVAGACRGNNVDILQEILCKYDDCKSRLLLDAFDGGAQDVLQFLAKKGIVCEDEESLVCAIRMGRYDAFDLFLESNPGLDVENAFLTACCGGHEEVVRRLMSRDFDEDVFGIGCMLACFGRYLGVIKCVSEVVESTDANVWLVFLCGPETPHLYEQLAHDSDVPQNSYEEIVDYLIEKGANDLGRALDAAVEIGCEEMIHVLQKKMNEPLPM
jgi:hypothetical protein